MITSDKLSNLDPIVDPIDDADLVYFVRPSEPFEQRGKKGTFLQLRTKLATLFEAVGTALGLINAHEAAVDPHPQYLTAAEGDVLFLTPAEGNAAYALLGHTHVSGDITNFAEAVDDRVAAILVAGTNIDSIVYNDGAGTITINAAAGGGGGITQEQAEDFIAAMIQNGTGITWVYNDAGGTLTPTVTITQYDNEMAQDAVGTILTNGGGITWTYNDAVPSISGVVAITSTSVTDFTEAVQDVVGTLIGDTGSIDATYTDAGNTFTLQLVNDNAAPGANMVYGTSGAGVKGWKADPVGGGGGSPYVYVATPADVNIASITDVTIASDAVTGLAAGDQLVIEAEFIILNNSAATRNIIVTLEVVGGAFDIELTLPALAFSTTLMHPGVIRGVLNVRSTSLAYFLVHLDMQLAAGIAAGTDTSAAATHLQAKGWGTTANDLTGTETITLFMRSAAATATQTCRLLSFRIKKLSPTDTGD